MLSMFESFFSTVSQALTSGFAAISAVVTTPMLLGAAAAALVFLYVTGYGKRLLVGFYGDFTGPELLKFGLLALAFFLIIGSYWTLRSIKDAFFDVLVGYINVPFAKILTVVAMVPLIFVYNKLVDCMSREKLFWVVCGFYSTLFVIFGLMYINLDAAWLAHSDPILAKISTVLGLALIAWLSKELVDFLSCGRESWVMWTLYTILAGIFGLAYVKFGFSPLALGDQFVSFIPGRAITKDGIQLFGISRLLGWLAFIVVETMGGVIVMLFWSYTHSTTNTILGKKGYPLLFIAAQAGNFAGPTIATYSEILGFLGLFCISAIILMVVPLIIFLYRTFVPDELRQTDAGGSTSKKKTGALEGIRLMGKHPYLMGLAFVATVYEIVGTLIDFQFKMTASQAYSGTALAAYIGGYGQWSAFVGIVFAALGTSFIIRRLGVRWSLLLYPSLLAAIIVMVRFVPVLNVLFWAMVCVKVLSYTLNNPVKELMYIPTSKDVKFKVKAVIDGFGGKLAKGLGSGINAMCSANPAMLVAYGTLASLGIVGVWIMIALVVGKTYDDLIASKKILD